MKHVSHLKITGNVQRPVQLTHDDLAVVQQDHQIPDMKVLDPKREGRAVRLAGLLELVEPDEQVRFIGLHSSADDFHASIPLDAIRDRAVLIYAVGDEPLSAKAGGPFRFFIPDHAACKTDEIDECANVKFVDWIELTVEKGQDNRPEDEAEHAALHKRQ